MPRRKNWTFPIYSPHLKHFNRQQMTDKAAAGSAKKRAERGCLQDLRNWSSLALSARDKLVEQVQKETLGCRNKDIPLAYLISSHRFIIFGHCRAHVVLPKKSSNVAKSSNSKWFSWSFHGSQPGILESVEENYHQSGVETIDGLSYGRFWVGNHPKHLREKNPI